jgi:hypothetical protein
MTLIDRYLNAIRWQLPESGRDDIVEELRDTLLSSIEEKEAALGRKLSDAEVEETLHAYGHPMRVAARYRTRQHLIGPEILPLYEFGLRAAAIVVGVLAALDLLISILGGERIGQAVTGALARLWHDGLYALGLLTFVALVLEFSGAKLWTCKWRLRDLPSAPAKTKRSSVFEAAFGFGVSVLCILWWTSAVPFPEAWLQGRYFDGARIEPASIWTELYWPILIALVLGAARSLSDLVMPGQARLRGAMRVAEAGAGVWVAAGLLQADSWARIVGEAGPNAAESLNLTLRITWFVAIAIFAVSAITGTWMLVRGRGR